MKAPHITRRRFAQASLATLALGVTGYSAFIEPNEIKIEERRLVLPRLPEAFHGLRVVQLSDLHYGQFTGERQIRKAVDQTNSLKPDLVVVTGDLATMAPEGKHRAERFEDARKCASILAGLRAPLGIFACLGNHDAGVDPHGIHMLLVEKGIRAFRNGADAVERDGGRLWVAAIDDVIFGHPDLDNTLEKVPKDEFTILLAHEPDFADRAAKYPIDLQLSGHSHGGQVRLPWIGALYYPPLSRKYPQGLYRVRNLHLYTNRGIGTIIVPLRLLAPPEVTLFTLDRQ